MHASARSFLPLVLGLASLAGCSAEGNGSLRQEVADLRSELDKAKAEHDKLKSQLAIDERRIAELAGGGRVRAVPVDAAPGSAAAAQPGEAAAGGNGDAGGPAAAAHPQAPAIKEYLSSDDGKKFLSEAIQADRDYQELQQTKREVSGMVDRFARTATLSDDQSKKMKDILVRRNVARREVWSSMRDNFDMAPEKREELQQQNNAKMEEMQKKSLDEVKAVLSQTQFEMYQQMTERMRGGWGQRGGGNGQGAQGGGEAGGSTEAGGGQAAPAGGAGGGRRRGQGFGGGNNGGGAGGGGR